MIYCSISDLSNLIRDNIYKIPQDIDLVIGIPRSGMLPAFMIALYLNKRVSDIDSFIEGRIFHSGEREKYITAKSIQKILVVDDSVDSGNPIKKAKRKMDKFMNDYNIIYCAPIVSPSGMDLVDIYFEIIDGVERIFEWNFYHHSFLNNACMDIDGVLCIDPAIDDDGPIYSNYIENATPLHIPTVEVNTLVSCRLEKYRPQTEKWLAAHGVRYKHLIMLDMPNKATRQAWDKHGEYKGKIYRDGKFVLFVESSLEQAIDIANIAHKECFCVETNSFIYPNFQLPSIKGSKRKIKNKLKIQYPSFFAILSKAKAKIKKIKK